MRIAMWSGPRNLSTAMMYAFGARSDCAVWDEPFYAPFLHIGGRPDPLLDTIFDKEETNPENVANRCAGVIPENKALFYQKHMPQHMLEGFPQDWMDAVKHVFLIRHPARVITSYTKKNGVPTLSEIGVNEQADLFASLTKKHSATPIVIDSGDIRSNPAAYLEALCNALNIPWDPAMLSWPAGGHKSDGAWAPHWYPEVWKSTGFAGPEGPIPEVPDVLQPLLNEAMGYYNQLAAFKLTLPESSLV